ncbi:hypothetical protein ACFX13_043123 [Malus domestica]
MATSDRNSARTTGMDAERKRKTNGTVTDLLSAGLVSNLASSLALPLATMNKKKLKGQSPRNPLRDLNAITVRSSNNGSDALSSIFVEALRGCFRFFLSHHSSSSNSKTPLYTTKSCRKPLNQLLL